MGLLLLGFGIWAVTTHGIGSLVIASGVVCLFRGIALLRRKGDHR